MVRPRAAALGVAGAGWGVASKLGYRSRHRAEAEAEMSAPGRTARLGQALVKAGVIDELQLKSALANADQWGTRLGKTLVRMRLVHETQVVKALSEATGFPTIDLSVNPPEPAARPFLDEPFCRERAVFPLAVREKAGARTLFLAMADPTDVEAIDLVASRCRGRVKPFVASEQLIEKAVDKFYRGAQVELALVDEATISELDEMKLVDVNGSTMAGVQAPVIHLREAAENERNQSAPSPAQRMAQRFAAADPLADLFGKAAPAPPTSDLSALEGRLSQLEQNLGALLPIASSP